MRPVNLFLTEDGVLKLGYYGLATQAECYNIKGMNCDGVRSFGPEVFEGEYGLENDVWSLGIALIEMMGIRPYCGYTVDNLPIVDGMFELPYHECDIESEDLVYFLEKCFAKKAYERWTVYELMDVSGMGWRMMSSIHL